MQEVFDKIIEKLGRKRAYYNAKFESTQNLHEKDEATTRFEDFNEAIEIVKQAAEECKHGHFGCNTNGQHEKCSTCCDYDCKNRNREWFGLKDDNNGWIPCSEDNKNFPADCERVRVTLWSGDEFTGYRKDDKWFVYGGCGLAEADVIAWQPTQPYRPSGDHKKKTNFDMCCESMEAMAQIIDIAKIGWTKEQIMDWLQKEACPVPD